MQIRTVSGQKAPQGNRKKQIHMEESGLVAAFLFNWLIQAMPRTYPCLGTPLVSKMASKTAMLGWPRGLETHKYQEVPVKLSGSSNSEKGTFSLKFLHGVEVKINQQLIVLIYLFLNPYWCGLYCPRRTHNNGQVATGCLLKMRLKSWKCPTSSLFHLLCTTQAAKQSWADTVFICLKLWSHSSVFLWSD